MKTSLRRFALVGLVAVALMAFAAGTSQAQNRGFRPYFAPINVNAQIAPGLTYRQYAYNLAVLGQGLGAFYRQIPPYAFYNPYPIYTNPYPIYVNPYSGYYNSLYLSPYLYAPFTNP
jgi:hypothetical protein